MRFKFSLMSVEFKLLYVQYDIEQLELSSRRHVAGHTEIFL